MTEMERKRVFDIELEKLTLSVVNMSHLVLEQLDNAILALRSCDLELAKSVIENDDPIDKLDIKIDILCQNIFALQQPVATDLRFIIASLKINNDLERIGDHAVNIAKRIKSMSDYSDLLKELGITYDIANQVVALYKIVDRLIETRQSVLAYDIFTEAKIIKGNCHLKSEKVIREMALDKDVLILVSNIRIILNLFERIADYSTNIAEDMIFVSEGKIIKHQFRSDFNK
jgi:phosphate transport system protein